MGKYRSSNLGRAGFIGVILVVLVIIVGLQPAQLWSLATTVRYQALFTEAGGLAVGNDVSESGMKVGAVTDVALHDGDALVTFTVDATLPLGAKTSAHVRTGSLLGKRVLTLESAGAESMRPGDTIPVSRTFSPYSLTQAVEDLTTDSAGTDTASLNQSLDTLSTTIDSVAPQLGPMFDGLTKLSQSLNGRDEALGEMFKGAADVTGILARRSDQLNTLLLDANDLVGVLSDRRRAIVELLANTSAVADQLSGLVSDNEKQLAPTLEKLNSVTAVLEKDRDAIAQALPGLAKYQLTSGEAVTNGFYYNAYIANLVPMQLLQPFLDYAIGFRNGTDAGQPPDNAGPRAQLPLPYNGIPGGSR
jgi:phospholipid/cholesterol/gamma-HCH transport system substrate-binding protein